jgi:hypothetical protein
MGNSPIFDMSKATPISAPTPLFDMSKATPLDAQPDTGWGLPHSWKEVWSRLTQKLPRPPGGGEEEEIAQGAPIAATGLGLIGTAGMGVEAIAARSLAPLYPLARGILGAIGGGVIGKEVGGLVGQPGLGGDLGALVGGVYTGSGGKVPSKADVMEFFNRPQFQETGAPLPSADEFYANHGKDIMAAMKQQPEAFGIPEPPKGAPLPSVAKFYEMRGREIMAAMKQQPEAFGFTKGPSGLVPAEPTPAGSSQDLITRTRKLVQPGQTPSAEDLKRAGDLTQAPLGRLKLLADWGDELAKNEINRRLRNQ